MKPVLSTLSHHELAAVCGGRCAVIGDSIALGLSSQMPQCAHNAKKGIPSADIIRRVPEGLVQTLLISAGTNDADNPRLGDNLRAIRRRAGGGVIWIAPVDARARGAVETVAKLHGDRVVGFTPAYDNAHPRSYAELARTIGRVD